MDIETVQTFFNRADAFAHHNGMSITLMDVGFARAEMEIQPHHLNGAQTVHGGVLFTLADFAFAAASNSHGQVTLSISSSLSIYRGAKTGRLIAEAREVDVTPKLATFDVSVKDDQGRLLASFHGTGYRKSIPLETLFPTVGLDTTKQSPGTD